MDTNKIKEDIIKLSITQSKLEHKIEKLRDIETKLEKVTNEKDDLEWEYGEYIYSKNIDIIKLYGLDKESIFGFNVYMDDNIWYLYLTDITNHHSVKFIVLDDNSLELYCYWIDGQAVEIGARYEE
jgi:hypothetical protein